MENAKLDNGAKDRNNSVADGSEAEFGGNNSNGNLNLSDMNANTVDDVNPCLQTFKACCKKKADFGLEDLFWILLLILIITFSVVKSTSRIGWSQWFYLFLGSIVALIVLYVVATLFHKFVLEDSSTAHWNAHARFTQAAIQSRVKEEEQRVHVIAPPKMGGAKLNIIYTVGDVPLVKPGSGGGVLDGAATLHTVRHPSSGSLGLVPHALVNLTQQTVSTAAAALITPTALDHKTTGSVVVPPSAAMQPIQQILHQEASLSAPTTPPSMSAKSFSPPHHRVVLQPEDIIEEEEPSRVLESPASLSEPEVANGADGGDGGGQRRTSSSQQQQQQQQQQPQEQQEPLEQEQSSSQQVQQQTSEPARPLSGLKHNTNGKQNSQSASVASSPSHGS